MQSITLIDLIKKFGGSLDGENKSINSVATLQNANRNQISFFSNNKYLTQLKNTKAGAIIVDKNNCNLVPSNCSKIISDNVYLYLSKVLNFFYAKPKLEYFIHKSAIIDKTANVSSKSQIGALVVIGRNVIIGDDTLIEAGVKIADNTVIGNNCIIHQNVTIYHDIKIGNNVEIHSGTVIGADGFGFAKDNNKWSKIPQIGTVIIHDDVNIGANTCIDRGALEDTIIGKGVIIDNLVQIAHNCIIGENTAMAAFVGLSGSTSIGNNCIMAGASKTVGHININDNTTIGGDTVVTKSISKSSHLVGVLPMQEFKNWRKNIIHIKHLDKMYQELKVLQKDFNLLQDKQKE